MGDHSEAFVGFDTSKLRNAVAIADAGRGGEVRFFGEIENTPAATAKLVRKLSAKYGRLTFCYEAGPTGYGLYRQIKSLGHACLVVAPSLIPKKPGDRVKTNRRDALDLARQLRAGELTAVWVPDERHEAMRDLTRAREAAVEELRGKRQQVSSFLLRQGRHYPGKKTWTKAHMSWLASQKLGHAEQRIAFEEMLLAIRQAAERIARLEEAIRAAVPDWSLCAVVTALMAMRGIDLISAAAFLAEIGDLSRFATPRELMAYLGLVPSEHSTGDTIKRGPITKAGNRRARRILVELSAPAACWKEERGEGCSRPARRPRDRLEGATPPLYALPGAQPQRQACDRRGDGGRARTLRLHLGRQSRNHDRSGWWQVASGNSSRQTAPQQLTQGARAGARVRRRIKHRATAGTKPRQGNSRFRFVADHTIDARAQTKDSPRRTSGHAVSTRESEQDHRRLKASFPPLHDHRTNSFHRKTSGRQFMSPHSLDKGHQSEIRGGRSRISLRSMRATLA